MYGESPVHLENLQNVNTYNFPNYLDFNFQTIIFKNGRFIQIHPNFVNIKNTKKINEHSQGIQIKNKALKIFKSSFLNKVQLIKKILLFNLHLIAVIKSFLQNLFTRMHLMGQNEIQINLKKGDHLLLLDSTWDLNFWNQIKKYKSNEVKIYSVIYDLIPIKYPQLSEKNTQIVFEKYLKKSVLYIDKYICISNTVAKELEIYLNSLSLQKIPKVSSFKLGADFKISFQDVKNKLDESILQVFNSPSKVFLQIGTIEPRKNHSFVLKAFDKVWKENCDIKLCIIGRIGWNVEELVNKILSHSEYGKKLFFFNTVDDYNLDFCLKNSNVLLFPSIVEGFGLPIIEGLNYNLTVFASDTEIHKEVGGDSVYYFGLETESTLVNLINKYLSNSNSFKLSSQRLEQISWSESAKLLLQEIEYN